VAKTTMEFPDKVLKKAKALAAERGVPLRELVTNAVEREIRENEKNAEKPWMKTIGALRHLHKENVRIQKIIDEEFETIDPEEWK